jgi:predicted small secreted protein
MRSFGLFIMLAAGMTLASCNRDSPKADPTAREVGRDAYRASEELKRGAKKVEQDVRRAGKEVREGWNEAKHEDPPPPKRK